MGVFVFSRGLLYHIFSKMQGVLQKKFENIFGKFWNFACKYFQERNHIMRYEKNSFNYFYPNFNGNRPSIL